MSPTPVSTDDYLSLFLHDIPLLDVRAPIEYSKGAFPQATNLPLLNNQQRHLIGTCYKQQGHDAAMRLGQTLATTAIKQERVQQWLHFVRQHPEGYLYCFRGGQRSRITQTWLGQAGYAYPVIAGGYKALRRFLMAELAAAVSHGSFIVLSGQTGTGKTQLIRCLANGIDLEYCANHRGSSFGYRPGGQPSPIDFEHRLAIVLLKHRHRQPDCPLIIEDESKLIGRCCLPPALWAKMQSAPVLVVDEPLEKRVDRIMQEYVTDSLIEQTPLAADSTQVLAAFSQRLRDSLFRIRKRLGNLRYQQLADLLEQAITEHRLQGQTDGYRSVITALLEAYYDPMYAYQLRQKTGTVLCRGDCEAILSYVSDRLLETA